MKQRNFINIDERYGEQEYCCLSDYRELNPSGHFLEKDDGIYQTFGDLLSDVRVAVKVPTAAAALGKIGGASRSER